MSANSNLSPAMINGLSYFNGTFGTGKPRQNTINALLKRGLIRIYTTDLNGKPASYELTSAGSKEVDAIFCCWANDTASDVKKEEFESEFGLVLPEEEPEAETDEPLELEPQPKRRSEKLRRAIYGVLYATGRNYHTPGGGRQNKTGRSAGIGSPGVHGDIRANQNERRRKTSRSQNASRGGPRVVHHRQADMPIVRANLGGHQTALYGGTQPASAG